MVFAVSLPIAQCRAFFLNFLPKNKADLIIVDISLRIDVCPRYYGGPLSQWW